MCALTTGGWGVTLTLMFLQARCSQCGICDKLSHRELHAACVSCFAELTHLYLTICACVLLVSPVVYTLQCCLLYYSALCNIVPHCTVLLCGCAAVLCCSLFVLYCAVLCCAAPSSVLCSASARALECALHSSHCSPRPLMVRG